MGGWELCGGPSQVPEDEVVCRGQRGLVPVCSNCLECVSRKDRRSQVAQALAPGPGESASKTYQGEYIRIHCVQERTEQ